MLKFVQYFFDMVVSKRSLVWEGGCLVSKELIEEILDSVGLESVETVEHHEHDPKESA